jgi:hypothetical protein
MTSVICTVAQLQVGDRFMYWVRPMRVQTIEAKNGKIEVCVQDPIAHCVWTLLFDEAWKVMKVTS